MSREINISGNQARAIDENARTVEISIFKRGTCRFCGGLVQKFLIINPSSVRLDRLNGGAAVLVEHDRRDQVGVVENARIDSDKKGRATIRFDSRNPKGVGKYSTM